jgi:hybrid cluster-associated redox disulfide protein
METPMISPDCLVDDAMSRFPATIRVFLDFRLGCIGCPIASFHSIDDACREHRIDPGPFMAALRNVVG